MALTKARSPAAGRLTLALCFASLASVQGFFWGHGDHIVAARGINSCPKNTAVMSGSACQNAAKSLGYRWSGTTTETNYPTGCYLRDSKYNHEPFVFFNMDRVGGTSEVSAPICHRSTTTTGAKKDAADQKAKEETDRKAKKDAADQKAKEEAARKDRKDAADQKAKEEVEWKAKVRGLAAACIVVMMTFGMAQYCPRRVAVPIPALIPLASGAYDAPEPVDEPVPIGTGRMQLQEEPSTILPTTRWENIVPTRSLVDELTQNPIIRERVPRIDDIVDDIQSKLQELRNTAATAELMTRMDDNDAGSILGYTHELNQPNGVKDGNLYFELNIDHRAREEIGRSTMMKRWGVFTHYILKGFSKLPDFEGDVFRGLPDRDNIVQEYQLGKPIQWSAFVSTTGMLRTAKNFGNRRNGIIAKIKVTSGKKLGVRLIPKRRFAQNHFEHTEKEVRPKSRFGTPN